MDTYARTFDTMEEALSKLPDKLVEQPFITIYNHYEKRFIHAGKKFFKYASLQILSPFAPKLVFKGEEERISINILLIANPSGGKTALLKKARELTPFDKDKLIQKQTAKELQESVSSKPEGVELIVNDMKTIMGDSELLKTYETVVADGFVKRETSRGRGNIDNEDVRAAMIGGCVPSDINNQIYGGLIFRIVPVKIAYGKDEQIDVGKHIAKGISEETEQTVTTQDISRYYDVIYNAMNGRYKDVPKIRGYDIDEEHANDIFRAWSIAIEELPGISRNANLTRQLYDGIRLMVLHTLLSLPNRELTKHEEIRGEETAKVATTDDDSIVGEHLVQNQMDTLSGFLDDPKVQQDLKQMEQFEESGKFDLSQI